MHAPSKTAVLQAVFQAVGLHLLDNAMNAWTIGGSRADQTRVFQAVSKDAIGTQKRTSVFVPSEDPSY